MFGAALLAEIGASDCEEIHAGFLAQPVNAVSSLAFSVVGIAIAWWARRAEGHERVVRVAFGIILVATGIGSFLFHGPQPAGAHFLHDITFLAALWFLAVINLQEANGWWRGVGWSAFTIGLAVLSVVLLIAPAATNLLTALVAVALVSADVAIRRRTRLTGKWYFTSLIAMSLAAVLLVLGRTGAPLCDADALFQGHAVWHILAAVAIGGYFVATSIVRSEGRQEEPA